MKKIPPSHFILLGAVAIVLGWSAWQPYDRLTWWLEVFPALAALVVLFATYRRFEFTTLTYTLIALHMCVLFVGGHYTYARVPLFDWLRPIFGWHRNHYDRLGHIMQGFVPAIVSAILGISLIACAGSGQSPRHAGADRSETGESGNGTDGCMSALTGTDRRPGAYSHVRRIARSARPRFSCRSPSTPIAGAA